MSPRNIFHAPPDDDRRPTAEDRLSAALLDLADRGRRTPCGDPDDYERWTSEDADELADAATRCPGCPIFTECEAAAIEKRPAWGIWGGRNYAPRRKTTP